MTFGNMVARIKEIVKDKRFIEALNSAEIVVCHYMDTALDSEVKRTTAAGELKTILARRGFPVPDRFINLAIEMAYALAKKHDTSVVTAREEAVTPSPEK